MIINYTKTGLPISDFKLEEYVKTCYKDNRDIHTSSELLIVVARALIYKGELDFRIVEFYFNGKFVGKANKCGRLDNFPDGFCDTFDKYLDILIGI